MKPTTVQDRMRQKIKALARSYKGKKILDLGCGLGDYTNILGGKDTVTGVDLQNVVLKKYRNFTFKKGDVTKLSFKDTVFDLVVSFDVIEHIEDDVKMIKEAHRVLKRGGKLFFGTPNRNRLVNTLLAIIGRPRIYPLDLGTDPGLGPTTHVREYTDKELVSLLTSVGFHRIKITPCCFGFPFIRHVLARPPFFLKGHSHYLFFEGFKK